jgi:hypothetical protein
VQTHTDIDLNSNFFEKSGFKLDTSTLRTDRRASGNSGFKKLAVQWFIEHSTSHQLLWWLDSFVLRNRQLLKPAKRYRKPYDDSANIKQTDMKRTILETIIKGLTAKRTANASFLIFFCQRTNFLIHFFANAQNTLSFFSLPTNPTQKKMKECFLQRFKKFSRQNHIFADI